jgi:mycothiol synthase
MPAAGRFPGMSFRELREEDAEQVARLFRIVFGDARPVDADEVVSWARNEELNAEWLRVVEREGDVVGYGDIEVTDDELKLDLAAPGHADPFFEWAEEQARSQRARRVRIAIPAGHQLEALVSERGYRLWRSSYTMEVTLDDALQAAPRIPVPLVLRSYAPENEDALRGAIDEAFADDPFYHGESPGHFREFFLRARGFDPSLWMLAWDEGELAGFLLAFQERYGEPGLGWISLLGVRRPWRGRGVAEGLLRAAFQKLHARGIRRVGLGVDAENATGALRLYERAGMGVVRQFNNWTLDLSE